MEDTHVWLIDANGKNRRGARLTIDNRQGEPGWSSDGRSDIFHGAGARRSAFVSNARGGRQAGSGRCKERGSVGSWSAHGDQLAYAFSTPEDQAELYLKTGDGPPES